MEPSVDAPIAPPPNRSARTWIGAGIGAAAIAAAAVVGVHALDGDAGARVATQRAGASLPGGTAMPGGGPGAMPGQRPPGVLGVITSISGSTIVVRDAFGGDTVTVHVSSATQVRGAATSLAGLATGDRVRAEGATASDGSVTATEIHVGEGPMGGGPGGGAPPSRGATT